MLPLFLAMALPLAALAQDYSQSPLVVFDAPAPQPTLSEQPDPNKPPRPPAPESPPSPQPAPKPEVPTPPTSPIIKLWPKDTVPIFMTSCTKFHVELAKPCACIITNVMADIPHEEFVAINARNQMETDPRILAIRQKCTEDLQDLKPRRLDGAD